SCSRSCALNRTTYFFTAMSFPAMIPSAARIAARANHLILSNWLKLATRKAKGISSRPHHAACFFGMIHRRADGQKWAFQRGQDFEVAPVSSQSPINTAVGDMSTAVFVTL